MTPPALSSTAVQIIQPGVTFRIDDYDINVLHYKGQLANQVWHFDVRFKSTKEDDDRFCLGTIRVGSAKSGSGLSNEVAIRETLENYQMIAPLLATDKREVLVLATESAATLEKSECAESADDESIADESADDSAATMTESGNSGDDGSIVQAAVSTDVLVVNEDLLQEPAERAVVEQGSDVSLSQVAEESAELPQLAIEEADEINGDILSDTSSPAEGADDTSPVDDESDTAAVEEPQKTLSPFEEKESLESSLESSFDEAADDDHLEEEYYDEKDAAADSVGEKLILLSTCPDDSHTLAAWLKTSHTQDENLSVLIQLCQFFRYLHQRDWCFVNFLPQFVQLSKPIQFYDLTGAHAVNDTLTSGFQGAYCAPELSYEKATIREPLSSYVIGALLHQLTYGKLFNPHEPTDTSLKPIPRISQILSICLSPVSDDRFPLNQLLDVLLATRQVLRAGSFTWDAAHRSTVGLSTSRLQNEDSYGVRQQQLNNANAMMLGIVADGMGGLAEGDVASRIAVETFLTAPMPAEMTESVQQQALWLEGLVQTANDAIASTVREGGTTLSAVLAINKTLTLAHVGDSRIYLLRGQTLRQISEDHSYVAMLVASGEITHEESLEHPERNVLTKSLGSKRQLASGYIQNMTHWGSSVSMELEDGDILLLCSDGVWDLVKDPELIDIFTAQDSIDTAVNTTIDTVLERGASDNATLLALKLNHRTSSPD